MRSLAGDVAFFQTTPTGKVAKTVAPVKSLLVLVSVQVIVYVDSMLARGGIGPMFVSGPTMRYDLADRPRTERNLKVRFCVEEMSAACEPVRLPDIVAEMSI